MKARHFKTRRARRS